MNNLRPIITERLPDDHLDIGRRADGTLVDWIARRADAYDWEPIGYGATPAEAEMRLEEAEVDFYS